LFVSQRWTVFGFAPGYCWIGNNRGREFLL
jgi:hypothetical protein